MLCIFVPAVSQIVSDWISGWGGEAGELEAMSYIRERSHFQTEIFVYCVSGF